MVEKDYHIDFSVILVYINLLHLWLIIYLPYCASFVYYVVTNTLD